MDQESSRIKLVYVCECEGGEGRLGCGFTLLYILYSIFYITFYILNSIFCTLCSIFLAAALSTPQTLNFIAKTVFFGHLFQFLLELELEIQDIMRSNTKKLDRIVYF